MYAIGIDVGTTNCKVCLYRVEDFALIHKHSFITPKITTEYGSDFDIEALWQGIVEGLSSTALSVNDPQNIISISVASVGEAGVLLDENGSIMGPVMTWYDTRTQPQLEKVVSLLGEEELYEITGIPPHSNYSLNKILWLLEHIKDRQAASWLCLAEFIAFRLTGVKRAEYSLASRTLAFDVRAGKWSEKICRTLELPTGIFSPLITAGEPTGELLAGLSAVTGIPTDAKISISGHDHMCGAVAVGISKQNQILNSTGTTEGLLVVSEQPSVTHNSLRSRVSNGCHVIDGNYTLYASLPSAGYAIEWFQNLFGLTSAEFAAMTQRLMQSGAATKPSESFLIPHLRGSGPPKRTIFAKGLLYGIGDRTSSEEVLRALLHGLCFELRLLMETYEALRGQRWESITVIGAACQNPYWLQLKATILNREILSCNVPEAVSKGAAMIGARGAGQQLPEIELPENALERYYPNKKAADHFNEVYTLLYKPLYESKIHIENQMSRPS